MNGAQESPGKEASYFEREAEELKEIKAQRAWRKKGLALIDWAHQETVVHGRGFFGKNLRNIKVYIIHTVVAKSSVTLKRMAETRTIIIGCLPPFSTGVLEFRNHPQDDMFRVSLSIVSCPSPEMFTIGENYLRILGSLRDENWL